MDKKYHNYAISFDLNQEALREHYIGKYGNSISSAYRDIRKFFESNGWEHKDGSVYHAKAETVQTQKEFSFLIREMDKRLPWMGVCVEAMNRTEILDSTVDIMNMLGVDSNLERKTPNAKQQRNNKEKKNPIKEFANKKAGIQKSIQQEREMGE